MKDFRSKIKKLFLIPLLALFLPVAPPAAAEPPPVFSKQKKIEIITELKEKYKIEKRDDLEFIGNRLYMTLDTLPGFMRTIKERKDVPNREEEMALALIWKEAEIIGLIPGMELRKTDRVKDKYGLMLHYKPYLKGILIEDVDIYVNFANRGYVDFASTVFRLTPEMWWALTANQLPKKRIARIVLNHLEPQLWSAWQWRRKLERESQRRKDRRKLSKPQEYEIIWRWWCGRYWRKGEKCKKITRLEQVITLEPPYLVWIAETVDHYRIDAFSGKILDLRSPIIIN